MWHPIADAETSRRCWILLEEIERCLAAHLSASRDEPRDPSLAGGDAGLALFFAYLGAARDSETDDSADRAFDALGRSAGALAEARLGPSLYSGFCGVGWVVEHLTRELFEGDEDVSDEVDEALRSLLLNAQGTPMYELISGLAGFGTYLTERMPHPAAAGLLGRVLDRLAETAEESDAGITWYDRPEWLSPWQREEMPGGCYNLGVAHGVPGVLGFLAAAHGEGIRDPRVERLAEGLVHWILGQQLPPGDRSVLPAFVVPGETPEPTRTAWCYGDLGVAAVLLSAARSFGREDWEREALAMARLAARRPIDSVNAIDTGLCHGAAGLAHLFNRLYQATGDPEIRDAALAWLHRTLDMQRPGEDFAGLMSWVVPQPGEGRWEGEHGFLTGIAGVGLALLAAVTGIEPAWDRVLLLSTANASEP